MAPPAKKTHKLTVRQRLFVLELLARHPHAPTKVAELVRQGTGVALTPPTLTTLAKRHAVEVQALRDAWLGRVPCASPRERVVELLALVELKTRELFRLPCPMCLGQGSVRPAAQLATAHAAEAPVAIPPVRCPTCRGRQWVLDEAVEAQLRALHAAGGRILPSVLLELDELAGLLPVTVPSVALAELQGLIKDVRAEMGDAWSPRERTAAPDAAGTGQQVTVVFAGQHSTYVERLRALRAAPPALGDGDTGTNGSAHARGNGDGG